MSKFVSLSIVFFTGISVTALEIASARIVSPFFGSTIYVWGGSIGTALAALALGYWLGGKVIDRIPKIIVVGVVLAVAGTSSVMIPLLYHSLLAGLQYWTQYWHIPVAVTVVVSMTSLFLIPLVAMGMISPIVLRLSLHDVQSAGSWSGLLSGTSTVGSIIGTFVSAYYTIPLLGTRTTILGAGVLLLLLSTLFIRWRYFFAMATLIVVASALTLSQPILRRPGLLWSKESAYQLVQVVNAGSTRYLFHDTASGAQSIYIPGQPFSHTLYDAFSLLPYLVDNGSNRRSVLVVGMAGGTSVRPFVQFLSSQFDFSITGVEIDPAVNEATKKYFDLDTLEATVITDDARHFLSAEARLYDIIIVDAYTNEMVIPPMLATKEFYQQLRDHLATGGVVGMNAAALPASRYFPKLVDTIATVFPDVRHAPFRPGALNHFVIAGSHIRFDRLPGNLPTEISLYQQQSIPAMVQAMPAGPIYTDDRTDLDIRVRPFVE